ncbi:MAG: hypothetical protein ACJ75Z_05285 [Solirubrobacterales bacterium]
MTRPRPSSVTALVAAALSLALVAGCGGSDNGTGSRSRPAPPAADFPSAKGKTLRQILLESGGHQGPVVSPAAAKFYVGTNRFPFGIFTPARQQISDAQVALYAAPGRGVDGPAIGPFPARIEDLTTKSAFRAQSTSSDPNAAQVAYVSDISFDKPGQWEFAALIKNGSSYEASLLPAPSPVGDYPSPRVGQPAPAVHTVTAGEVSSITQIDTRVPPDDMHSDDLADVLGKKPVVLLFATPALCQSRVCGPVTDIAEQVKQTYGDRVAFIHQEVYNNNQIRDGIRPQLRAYRLTTEPWCFVIDRSGRVSTVLQGPFSVQELQAAVQKVAA